MTETKTAALAVLVTEPVMDKSEWGPGPWQDEPDFVEWQSEQPPHYWCQINRNMFGSLCGYVAIPPGHPAHGVSYNDLLGGLALRAITYGGPGVGDLWVFGFACSHFRDLCPQSEAHFRNSLPPYMYEHHKAMNEGGPEEFRQVYRTLSVVRDMVEDFARNLALVPPREEWENAREPRELEDA